MFKLRYFGLFLVAAAAIISSCSLSKLPQRQEVHRLLTGETKDDTSYVYGLPFREGTSMRVIQGYFSHFSHKHHAAIDFNMKEGTEILAARDGVVMFVKEDGDRGGLKAKYRPYGNNIIIQHSDNTRSGYWHLQKDGALVNVGDTVRKGQVIGYSGKTGFTSTPHLHFWVWKSDYHGGEQIATRFETKHGPQYLQFWKRYKNPVKETTITKN